MTREQVAAVVRDAIIGAGLPRPNAADTEADTLVRYAEAVAGTVAAALRQEEKS